MRGADSDGGRDALPPRFIVRELLVLAATTLAWMAALIIELAPARLSGRLAIGLAWAGVLATFVLELPITLRVLRGAPLPTGSAYRPHAR
jgi:hypothetical protein